MMRSLTVSVPLFGLAIGLCGLAQAQQPNPREVAAIARPFVDPRGLDPEAAPGLVVGVVTPDGARTFGFGVNRVGSGKRPDGETAFQIGSVSKALTGLLLAEQVTLRGMRLSDPANRALGGDLRLPAPGGQPITLGQLITHRAGLPSMPSNLLDRDGDGRPDPGIPRFSPGTGYSRRDLARYLQDPQLLAPPGARYVYSNTGSALAAIAVQDRLGLRSFDELLRQRLSIPLRLRSTGTNTPAFVRRVSCNAAAGHASGPDGLSRVPFSDMGVLAGAGEVISTADDMLRILSVLAGLERGPLAAAAAEAVRPLQPGAQGKAIAYAIDVEPAANGPVFSKSGSVAGYSAYVTFRRDTRVGVVVLANRGSFPAAGQIGREVLASLSGGAAPAPSPTPDATITCPVRVFRYRFEADASFDATFDLAQLEALFAEVNAIWAQAGIEFELGAVEDRVVSTAELASVTDLDSQAKLSAALRAIAPPAGGQREWTVVTLRKMPITAGGVYDPTSQTAFYAELNRRGEHHPEILAHELGHSLLGGGHEQDSTNVMGAASPDASTHRNLTAEQIDDARAQAAIGPFKK